VVAAPEAHTAYALMALLGLVAGFINAIAAGGSALTLPALVLLGLRPRVDRIALILSGVTRLFVFHRAGVVDWREGLWLVPTAAAGGLIGASVALLLPSGSDAWPIAASVLLELGFGPDPRRRLAPAPEPATTEMGRFQQPARGSRLDMT
jgi:uncharacterized protein